MNIKKTTVGVFILSLLACSAWASPDGKTFVFEELEFRQARVQDAIRSISEISGENIIATAEAAQKTVALYLCNKNVFEVVDSLCRVSGLWYRHNEETGTYVVMTTKEYQEDIVVFRNATTRMFHLEYLNVEHAARSIYDLFGYRVQWEGRDEDDEITGYQYEVGGAFDKFTEENENGSDGNSYRSGSSRNRSSSRSRSSSSRSTGPGVTEDLKQAETGADLGLSADRIARLEMLSGDGALTVDERLLAQVGHSQVMPIYLTINKLHNLLFVRTADESALDQIEQIIEESDRQVPEVLLEMKVLEVELNDEFNSAFNIDYLSGDGQNSISLFNNSGLADSTLVFEHLSDNLELTVEMLAEDSNVKALATPMLMAANNQPATLFIGETVVFTTGFETEDIEIGGDDNTVYTIPVPQTEIGEIGNTLTILPSINADRSVVMRLVHENSTLLDRGSSIPVVNYQTGSIEQVDVDTTSTSRLEGTVLALDGKTIAVGGMMRTEKTEVQRKIPLLGDLPLLGFFFRDTAKQDVKSELILLITPHVLRAPGDGEAVTRERLGQLSDYTKEFNLFNDKNFVPKPVVEPSTYPEPLATVETVTSVKVKEMTNELTYQMETAQGTENVSEEFQTLEDSGIQ